MSINLILFSLLGIFLFLFFFWRRLKEDYVSSQIFSLAFYILLPTLALGFLIQKLLVPQLIPTNFFHPQGLWFWGGGVGFAAGFLIGIKRFKFKLLESFEAAVLGLFYWLGMIFLNDGLTNSSLFSLGALGVMVVLIIAFYVIDRKYKSFTWYRSGRVGLAGLLTSAVFFLVRALVACIFPFVLSLIGQVDALASAPIAFGLFLGIYHLARQKF